MVPLSMTLIDLWPRFQYHNILNVAYRKNGASKKQLLFHTNRNLYLTYGMLLCLVTLADLWPCRVGLSASAELLVKVIAKTLGLLFVDMVCVCVCVPLCVHMLLCRQSNFKLKGIPVLFIPGSAGSYRQGLSLSVCVDLPLNLSASD